MPVTPVLRGLRQEDPWELKANLCYQVCQRRFLVRKFNRETESGGPDRSPGLPKGTPQTSHGGGPPSPRGTLGVQEVGVRTTTQNDQAVVGVKDVEPKGTRAACTRASGNSSWRPTPGPERGRPGSHLPGANLPARCSETRRAGAAPCWPFGEVPPPLRLDLLVKSGGE